MFIDMKGVVILVVTQWTLSNIVHAGLPVNCTSVNSDAYCKAQGTGDPNAVCATAGQKCTCADTFKVNGGGDGCDAKVLNDSCTGDASCADIANALCNSGRCACPPGYFAGSTCVKIIGGTCVNVGNCAGVKNSKCVQTKCTCDNGYKDVDDLCKPRVTATTCSSSVKCSMDHASCNTTSTKCKCDAGYVEKVDKCENSGNGVSSLTANMWILCSMLATFGNLMKF